MRRRLAVNRIVFAKRFDPGFHTHSRVSRVLLGGSMQVEFQVEVRRCYLSREIRVLRLRAQSPQLTSSRQHL
jgi:hypothetical protein